MPGTLTALNRMIATRRALARQGKHVRAAMLQGVENTIYNRPSISGQNFRQYALGNQTGGEAIKNTVKQSVRAQLTGRYPRYGFQNRDIPQDSGAVNNEILHQSTNEVLDHAREHATHLDRIELMVKDIELQTRRTEQMVNRMLYTNMMSSAADAMENGVNAKNGVGDAAADKDKGAGGGPGWGDAAKGAAVLGGGWAAWRMRKAAKAAGGVKAALKASPWMRHALRYGAKTVRVGSKIVRGGGVLGLGLGLGLGYGADKLLEHLGEDDDPKPGAGEQEIRDQEEAKKETSKFEMMAKEQAKFTAREMHFEAKQGPIEFRGQKIVFDAPIIEFKKKVKESSAPEPDTKKKGTPAEGGKSGLGMRPGTEKGKDASDIYQPDDIKAGPPVSPDRARKPLKRPMQGPTGHEPVEERERNDGDPIDRPGYEKVFKDTPLHDKKERIEELAKKHGIPASVLTGIIALESSRGKNLKGNNPGGLMKKIGPDKYVKREYETLDEGLEETARNAARHWKESGGDLNKMNKSWAKPGDVTDITGTNKDWATNVGKLQKQFEQRNPSLGKILGKDADWKGPLPAHALDRALKLEGLHEGRDRADIAKFLRDGGRGMDPARTAWCASFVSSALQQEGIRGAGDMASSFKAWGAGVDDPSTVQKGDVMVRDKGIQPGGRGEHVGFATGKTRVNPRTGALELEMFSGNTTDPATGQQTVARKTWEAANRFKVRRATEKELMNPEDRKFFDRVAKSGIGSQTDVGDGAKPDPATEQEATNAAVDIINKEAVVEARAKRFNSFGMGMSPFAKQPAVDEPIAGGLTYAPLPEPPLSNQQLRYLLDQYHQQNSIQGQGTSDYRPPKFGSGASFEPTMSAPIPSDPQHRSGTPVVENANRRVGNLDDADPTEGSPANL